MSVLLIAGSVQTSKTRCGKPGGEKPQGDLPTAQGMPTNFDIAE